MNSSLSLRWFNEVKGIICPVHMLLPAKIAVISSVDCKHWRSHKCGTTDFALKTHTGSLSLHECAKIYFLLSKRRIMISQAHWSVFVKTKKNVHSGYESETKPARRNKDGSFHNIITLFFFFLLKNNIITHLLSKIIAIFFFSNMLGKFLLQQR